MSRYFSEPKVWIIASSSHFWRSVIGNAQKCIDVRWFTPRKSTEQMLREEPPQFVESKAKDTKKFWEEKFRSELAFRLHYPTSRAISIHWTCSFRGKGVTSQYTVVRASKIKIRLWKNQMLQRNMGRFVPAVKPWKCTSLPQCSPVHSLLKSQRTRRWFCLVNLQL